MKHKKIMPPRPNILLIVTAILLGISPVNSQVGLTRALDYDGDRRADPAVFRTSDDSWWILRTGGGGWNVSSLGDSRPDTMTPGDFDGDRRGDVASWRETTGTFHYLRSSDSAAVSVPFGQPGYEPVARDYDGDERTDCAVIRRQDGYLYWHILQSSTGSYHVSQYGIATDSPMSGDYDGDRYFDLAVQRQQANHTLLFYIYGSSTGASSFQFGADSDLVVPGDYDGDGATDLAVCRWEFRQGDKFEWIIRKSSDGEVYQDSFGRADLGDIPVQADYDGDGKTDIAVWRSPEQRFYIYQSSNNQTISFRWGAEGDLPVASYDTH